MKKKTIALALVLVMVFGATLGGTFAYLTSTDEVVNTFTVGNVQITMDEAKVNLYGKPVNADGQTKEEYLDIEGNTETGWVPARTDGNQYKLIPGHTYTKDPTIYMDEESEDAWLVVQIVNNLSEITTITGLNGWTAIDAVNGIYGYNTPVSAEQSVEIFGSFSVSGTYDPDATGTTDYEGKTIEVTAYAIQKDGFSSAEAAWNATFASKS